ncbi:MAG: glucokinase [Betaproteobacteria bacterium]|nr:glucokinase [Betaproteobacteria bacterium]
MRLVGDIGGTNARFAVVEQGRDSIAHERVLRCADYEDLGAAVEAYLDKEQLKDVEEAAIAVATPVTGDHVSFTNSDWSFSIRQTEARLGLRRLKLVNDFAALALALPVLGNGDLRRVGGGAAVDGKPLAVLGAGTGLGVSGLFPSGSGWIPIEGEGGHTAFSPMTSREVGVLEYLWRRFDHVSTERLASGPGLALIHEALSAMDGAPTDPVSPESVTSEAAQGDARSEEAVEMFCGVLGTAAANLCVTIGARGGVYIGGGVVPALGSRFDRSCFRARFEQMGRFSSYVSSVPTFVITASNPALRGALRAFDAA